MKMKTTVNGIVSGKATTMSVAPIVWRSLGLFGAGALVMVAYSCKTQQMATPVKPELKGYEIKVGMGGSSTTGDAEKTGISINNTGMPNNSKTYYFVPSNSDAGILYGGNNVSATKDATTTAYGLRDIGLFGKNDTVNSGIVMSKQLLEILSNAIVTNVSGGSCRLVHYNVKTLYIKKHIGYATQGDYVINRTNFGLAGIWVGATTENPYALWVIPENKKTYTVKVPFNVVPEADAGIRVDSNFFTYTSDARRQIEVAITEPTPVNPAAYVRDFQFVKKPTGAFAFGDLTPIIYTAVDAAYADSGAMACAIGDTAFRKARGDTAISFGSVKLEPSKISNALGNPKEAGMGMVVTRTGVLATYYRLQQGDAKDTAASSMVQVPQTKYVPGLKVLETCKKTSSDKPENFEPVIGEGCNLVSFMTNVPGEKDTMQLHVVRKSDGDIISLKMGLQGVSKITHKELMNGDILVDVFGADNKRIGGIIISKGVPYEPLRTKNRILKDEKTGYAPMENKYNKMLYKEGYIQAQNKLRNRFANRSI
ncbi:MAG: hypothetical protein NTX79_01450 [Candidatus Micrarchaeota archaeon]|nr:hypothetical protein [Candidatus Micrarchaeota archaeon]